MEINLFYESVDSKWGYQSSVLKMIDEQVHFNKCLMTVKKHDDMDVYDKDKYVLVNYDICEHNAYDKEYDFNDMQALSRDVLEKMQPYESTAMKMLIRNMEIDVYTYEEAKRYYLRHLRFWNHMFDTLRINFVILNCTPHHTHDYIIYALAKVKNLGLCVNTVTNIKNWWFTGNDIRGIGEKVTQEYYRNKDNKDENGMPVEAALPEQIEKYYQALIYKPQGMDDTAVCGGKTSSQMKKTQNETFWSFAGKKNAAKRNFKRLKASLKKSLVNKDDVYFKQGLAETKEDLYYLKRIRLKMKAMRSLKYFNSLTSEPDYNEKYIVYYLHYQPEGTTLPQAGVFVEQELIVQLIAKALEGTGVKLYVKEHFVQLYRSKAFYDDLAAIRGVKLIHSDVSSKELMMHAVAVSACNGTAILEAIINNIPALSFTEGGFAEGPGLFPISSEQECRKIVLDILAGKVTFNQHDVRTYFKAFADKSVYSEFFISRYDEPDEAIFERSRKECAARAVEAIQEMQKGGVE